VIKIPGTGGGFGANGSDGGVDGTFGVELILKCIMCITSKVFYETMINDERFSLSVVIWRPSSQRKKERKRNFVFFGRKRYFFFKSEKRLLTDGQKGDKKKSRKREKHPCVRQITHAL